MVRQGHTFLRILLFFLSVLTALPTFAKQAIANGYIEDVAQERSEHFIEIYLLATPNPADRNLQAEIFNAKLSKEFRDRYQEKFGQMDTDSIIYQPTKFSMMDENRGAVENIELENEKRQAFAEYMTKRLSEYHVDNYFKSQPNMRAVYEAKERLQNIKVQVNKDVRLNAQYSLAGNILDVVFENPWLDSKLSLEMNPASFGPSNVQESRVWLGKKLSKHTRINSNAAFTDGIGLIELIRSFRGGWTASVGASSFFRNAGTSEREHKMLLGMSHYY